MLPPAVEAAAPAPDAFARRAWGKFSRESVRAHTSETVELALDGKMGNQREYKLRLTLHSFNAPDERSWTNSRTCPAVRIVLERLHALKPPAIVPPGFDPQSTEILVDGTAYDLMVPTADAVGQSRITWSSNIGTPLAAWVDDSLALLKPCWSMVELRVAPAKE